MSTFRALDLRSVASLLLQAEDAWLSIDSDRPLISAAETLAKQYRIPVSAEGPVYIDAAKERVHLDVRFAVNAQGFPQDIRAALQAVADAANQKLPYKVRLEQDGDDWTLISLPALLDRHVTIPPGRRRVNEHVQLLTNALSAQAGYYVSCCQAMVAGIPWGMETIDFAAYDEPARSVLWRLIRATPGRHRYVQRCSTVIPGCFINLETPD